MKKKMQISAIIFIFLSILAFIGLKLTNSTTENPTDLSDNFADEEIMFDDDAFEIENSLIMLSTIGEFIEEADVKIVRSEITLPVISGLGNDEFNMEIEKYYNKVAEKLSYFLEDNEDFARNAYLSNPEGFAEYIQKMSTWVSFEDENLISIVRTTESFTGGAQIHPTLYSEVFRVSDGALMLFDDVLSLDENKTIMLEYVIENYLDDTYYANASELVYDLFDASSYFLGEDGVYLYYQKYDIAPGMTDLPVFLIPYAELNLRENYKYLGEINE